MQRTSPMVFGRLGHWSIWRSQYLRMISVDDSSTDYEVFYGGVGDLEWEPMVRVLHFVKASLELLSPSFPPFSTELSFEVFPTESQRHGLRRLAVVHNVPFFPESTWDGYTSPEIAFLHLLERLVVINRTEHTLGAIGSAQRLGNLFINMIRSTSSIEHGSSFFSIHVATVLCWRSPDLCTFLAKRGYHNGLSVSAFCDHPLVNASLSATLWRSKLPSDFEMTPTGLSMAQPTHKSLQPTPSSCANVSSLQPTDLISDACPFASISYPKNITGIYRLFFHYSHPELESEGDSGWVDFRQDEDTLRITGNGIDTMRGPFEVFDPRIPGDLEKEAAEWKSCSKVFSLLRRAPIPESLVLRYTDGSSILLSGKDIIFGIGGDASLDSTGEMEPYAKPGTKLRSSFGGFSLIYDHEATTAIGKEKNDLCNLAWAHAQEIVAFPFPFRTVYPNAPERDRTRPFDPWNHVNRNVKLLYHSREALSISRTISVFRENSSFMELLKAEERMSIQSSPHHTYKLTIPRIQRYPTSESGAVFTYRISLWKRLVPHYFTALVLWVVDMAPSTLASDLELLESRQDDYVRDVLLSWSRTLKMHPKALFLPKELVSLLKAAQSAIESSQSKDALPRHLASPSFRFGLPTVFSRHFSQKGLIRVPKSWLSTRTGIFTAAIVGAGFIVCSGAIAMLFRPWWIFQLGRRLSFKNRRF